MLVQDCDLKQFKTRVSGAHPEPGKDEIRNVTPQTSHCLLPFEILGSLWAASTRFSSSTMNVKIILCLFLFWMSSQISMISGAVLWINIAKLEVRTLLPEGWRSLGCKNHFQLIVEVKYCNFYLSWAWLGPDEVWELWLGVWLGWGEGCALLRSGAPVPAGRGLFCLLVLIWEASKQRQLQAGHAHHKSIFVKIFAAGN